MSKKDLFITLIHKLLEKSDEKQLRKLYIFISSYLGQENRQHGEIPPHKVQSGALKWGIGVQVLTNANIC